MDRELLTVKYSPFQMTPCVHCTTHFSVRCKYKPTHNRVSAPISDVFLINIEYMAILTQSQHCIRLVDMLCSLLNKYFSVETRFKRFVSNHLLEFVSSLRRMKHVLGILWIENVGL